MKNVVFTFYSNCYEPLLICIITDTYQCECYIITDIHYEPISRCVIDYTCI